MEMSGGNGKPITYEIAGARPYDSQPVGERTFLNPGDEGDEYPDMHPSVPESPEIPEAVSAIVFSSEGNGS